VPGEKEIILSKINIKKTLWAYIYRSGNTQVFFFASSVMIFVVTGFLSFLLKSHSTRDSPFTDVLLSRRGNGLWRANLKISAKIQGMRCH
jgi:hypothetical protein